MSDRTFQLKTALLTTKGAVSLYDNISISDKIEVDLTGKNIDFNGKFNYKITATNTASPGSTIAAPQGCLTISNAVNIKISNLTIQGTSSGLYPALDNTTNFNDGNLCGLLIKNCSNVILDNVTALDCIYAGIMIVDCNNVQLINCKASGNLYAGCLIRRSKVGIIKGGSFSNNGIAMTYSGSPYNAGYGLDFTQGLNTALGQNENWEVSGVTADKNLRIGIGAHQLVRGHFHHNNVLGYGMAGMAFTNQGYEFWVKDLIVEKNIIEQDAAFYLANAVENHKATPITVGSYGSINDLTNYTAGSIIVTENIIKNFSSLRSGSVDYTDYAIFCWANLASTIQIKNNAIEKGNCQSAILVGLGNGHPTTNFQPGIVDISGNEFNQVEATLTSDLNAIICCLAGQSISINKNKMINCETDGTGNAAIRLFSYGGAADIQTLNIANNTIQGIFNDYGITAVNISKLTTIHDNTFSGEFGTGYWDLDSAMRYRTYNNTTDNIVISGISANNVSSNLPDFYKKGNGSVKYFVETAGASVTLKTLTVDATEALHPAGASMLYINIYMTGPNGLTAVTFPYLAYARNNETSHVVSFGIIEQSSVINIADGNPDSDVLKPALTWVGAGDEKTLEITLPFPFFSFSVEIEFVSVGFLPYQKP